MCQRSTLCLCPCPLRSTLPPPPSLGFPSCHRSPPSSGIKVTLIVIAPPSRSLSPSVRLLLPIPVPQFLPPFRLAGFPKVSLRLVASHLVVSRSSSYPSKEVRLSLTITATPTPLQPRQPRPTSPPRPESFSTVTENGNRAVLRPHNPRIQSLVVVLYWVVRSLCPILHSTVNPTASTLISSSHSHQPLVHLGG